MLFYVGHKELNNVLHSDKKCAFRSLRVGFSSGQGSLGVFRGSGRELSEGFWVALLRLGNRRSSTYRYRAEAVAVLLAIVSRTAGMYL